MIENMLNVKSPHKGNVRPHELLWVFPQKKKKFFLQALNSEMSDLFIPPGFVHKDADDLMLSQEVQMWSHLLDPAG